MKSAEKHFILPWQSHQSVTIEKISEFFSAFSEEEKVKQKMRMRET